MSIKTPIKFVVSEVSERRQRDSEDPDLDGELLTGDSSESEAFDVDELKEHLDRHGFEYPSQDPIMDENAWISTGPIENREYFEKDIETINSLHLKGGIDAEGKELDKVDVSNMWAKLLSNHVHRFDRNQEHDNDSLSMG